MTSDGRYTPEDVDKYRKLFEGGGIELTLEANHFVLRLEHWEIESAPDDSPDYAKIAKVRLQDVLGFSARMIQNQYLGDFDKVRAELFAMAGRLREAVRYVEELAAAHNRHKWESDDWLKGWPMLRAASDDNQDDEEENGEDDD